MLKFLFAIFFLILIFFSVLFEINRDLNYIDSSFIKEVDQLLHSKALEIRRKIASMPLDEKIGQMLMVSFSGTSLTDDTKFWLCDHYIGGVILLGKNVRDKAQIKELIWDLQHMDCMQGEPQIFIAADQEGGMVSRFLFLRELTAQADIHEEKQAFFAAEQRGLELKELGVSINFSPVLDISSSSHEFIYPRTFRGDADTVARLGSAMIKGYQESGIIPAGKHFPGHGGSATDSHKMLPMREIGSSDLAHSLIPFEQAISNGVEMIMVGHIKIPMLDDRYPASLSAAITGDLLRKKLGYQGVIITDDLGMGAITNSYTLPESAVQAVASGADIVLVVRNLRDYTTTYDALKKSVTNGQLSEKRINQSVTRIIRLKMRLPL